MVYILKMTSPKDGKQLRFKSQKMTERDVELCREIFGEAGFTEIEFIPVEAKS